MDAAYLLRTHVYGLGLTPIIVLPSASLMWLLSFLTRGTTLYLARVEASLCCLCFFFFFLIRDLAVKNPLHIAVSQQKSLCFLILASSHLFHMPRAWFSIQVIFRSVSEVSCASSLSSVMLVVGLKGEVVFTSTRTSSIRCWATASSYLQGSTLWLCDVPSG